MRMVDVLHFPGLAAVPPSAWVALVSVVGLPRHGGEVGGAVAKRPAISRARPGPLGGFHRDGRFRAFPGGPGVRRSASGPAACPAISRHRP